MRRAFGNENHGVQVDTVAHRDHGFAPLEIERGGDWLKMLRRFAGVVGIARSGALLHLRCTRQGDSCHEDGYASQSEAMGAADHSIDLIQVVVAETKILEMRNRVADY
jgi:hypothetical protein